MPMYVITTIPLIKSLNKDVQQVWYADDVAVAGKVKKNLHLWWDQLVAIGPEYSYHINANKIWLVTKESHYAEAMAVFANSVVNIIPKGSPIWEQQLTPQNT